jgi:hypothetical protein
MSMDWRSNSRSRSRAPISRASLPSQPILSTDAAAEASFATAVGELDPNSVAALFTRLPSRAAPKAQQRESSAAESSAPTPAPIGRSETEPYYQHQFDDNLFEQTLNSLLTGGEGHHDESAPPQAPVWSTSLPSDRMTTTAPSLQGQQQQQSNSRLEGSALAWRHWHAMHDEAVHNRGAGSIPGLMDERSLKENQHAEFGFLPRLVRKTSYDERSGRPGAFGDPLRPPEGDGDARSRRPSPARPVIGMVSFPTHCRLWDSLLTCLILILWGIG